MRKGSRRGIILTTVLLSSAVALSGCMQKTGDLGNKNIRPNSVTRYNSNDNGVNNMRSTADHGNAHNRMYGVVKDNDIVRMHSNSRLELNNKVADKIAEMPGIKSAYVMMTNNNAYVAINEDDKANTGHSAITSEVKDKIADQVKSLSPSCENVYVSQNPDFMGRMEGYANDVKAGHPIQGFLAEFNAMAERIFPASAGTSHGTSHFINR